MRPQLTTLVSLTLAALSLSLGAVPAAQAQPASAAGGISFELHTDASEQKLDLPIYPGAVRQAVRRNESNALTLGAWAGGKGFQLVVQRYEVRAPADAVLDFYRQRLAQYGAVIDCSQAPVEAEAAKSSDRLGCDAGDRRGPARVLKVGTKKQQRIASIARDGDGVKFDLVRLQLGD